MRDILSIVEGDIVVCTGDENISTSTEGSGAGWEKNLCFEVREVTQNSKIHYVAFIKKRSHGVWTDQLRFATEEEIIEYQSQGGPYTVKQVKLPTLEEVLSDLDKRIARMERKQKTNGKARV